MNFILNLRMEPASEELRKAGVVELPAEARVALLLALQGRLGGVTSTPEGLAEYVADMACENGLGEDFDDPLPYGALIDEPAAALDLMADALFARGITPVGPDGLPMRGEYAGRSLAAKANVVPLVRKAPSAEDNARDTVRDEPG